MPQMLVLLGLLWVGGLLILASGLFTAPRGREEEGGFRSQN